MQTSKQIIEEEQEFPHVIYHKYRINKGAFKIFSTIPLSIKLSSQILSTSWDILIISEVCLRQIELSSPNYYDFFTISRIILNKDSEEIVYNLPNNTSEWVCDIPKIVYKSELKWKIQVNFKTPIPGNYRTYLNISFITHEIIELMEVKVDNEEIFANQKVIRYNNALPYISNEENELERLYPFPSTLVNSKFEEGVLSLENYKEKQHACLFLEEKEHQDQLSKMNFSGRAVLPNFYSITGDAKICQKTANEKELFAFLPLPMEIIEDSPAGRIFSNNCNLALISKRSETPSMFYEALVESKGKDAIYLRLSELCVAGLKLKLNGLINLNVKFELNRVPFCEKHYAIDNITELSLLFPDVHSPIPIIPEWTSKADLSPELNHRQKEAINMILTSSDIELPPILIIGPFGTGKTLTMAEATKEIATRPDTRVLICTLTNCAADLYIKDHIHPYINNGHPDLPTLRVYATNRRKETVDKIVLKYCLESKTNGCNFCIPTKAEIEEYKIVVTTLAMSRVFVSIGLPKGFFTHILIDEAAQSLESATVMGLSLATKKTRVIFTGDHMQINPQVYSEITKKEKFHISILERLYNYYPNSHPCKILLNHNYRSHNVIIDFTSEMFYNSDFSASGNQTSHQVFYPLTFHDTRGKTKLGLSSISLYNDSEVYDTVEEVRLLISKWPTEWDTYLNNIVVICPYNEQVQRIREVLKKKRIYGINVESVYNVQGKEFRAVILNTVKVIDECESDAQKESDADWGFLSDPKLLSTAITRARSLVIVVGDSETLCSFGKCRNIWQKYISIAKENKVFKASSFQFSSSAPSKIEGDGDCSITETQNYQV